MFFIMKKLLFLALFSITLSATLFAQQARIMGNWSGQFTGPEGKPLPFKMTISENTYQFDIGGDGVVDITGSYTMDGTRVTVWDTAGQNICPSDQKGVYEFTFSGDDSLTFTKVSDACPGRGAEPLVLKRM